MAVGWGLVDEGRGVEKVEGGKREGLRRGWMGVRVRGGGRGRGRVEKGELGEIVSGWGWCCPVAARRVRRRSGVLA